MKRLFIATLAFLLATCGPMAPAAESKDYTAEYVLTTQKAVLFLMKGQFLCPAGKKRAVFVGSGRQVIAGCWYSDTQDKKAVFQVDFEDGDHITVPIPQSSNQPEMVM